MSASTRVAARYAGSLLLLTALLWPAGPAQAAHRPKTAAQDADAVHVAAMQSARSALAAFLARDYATAAQRYGEAARQEPDVAEFAFGEARSYQELGLADAATPIFARVIAMTTDEHPLHAKAMAALRALQHPPVSVVILPPAPTPTAPVRAPIAAPEVAVQPTLSAARVVPAKASWRRPAALGAFAIGVAAAAVATGLAVSATNQQAALDAHKMPDGRYDLSQISYDAAVSDQRGINSRWTWAAVAGGAGAAAIATAVWWFLTDRSASRDAASAPQVGYKDAP